MAAKQMREKEIKKKQKRVMDKYRNKLLPVEFQLPSSTSVFKTQPEVCLIPQPEVCLIPQPEVCLIPQPEVCLIPQPEVSDSTTGSV
jgi:hypothetical protein